ncbi:hypothetical protein, partial [Streptomyces sp. NPDC059762]
MSFGDPNNPYGQPPQGQQPGYGYPQAPQQGYGYPAAPGAPYGAYPGAPYGAPGMMVMPGTVKAARVLVWIIAIIQILGGIAVAALAGTYANEAGLDSASSNAVTGVVVGLAVFAIALGIWGIVIAAKTANGGNGIRVSAIVYGSLVTLGGVANLAQGQNASVVALVLGIL